MRTLVLFLLFAATSHAQIADKYAAKATKKWEGQIQKFEKLDKKNDYPADSILFVGSSSIRLWDTIKRDMAPFPVIQRGYGGAKFQDLAVFAERIVHPHDFRAVVIFVGNDIAGNADDIEPAEVGRLFDDVVDTIREKNKVAPVFLIAVTPTQSRFDAWPNIKQANAEMQKVCERREGVHFIATESHFFKKEDELRNELFRADRLHLNKDGYKMWSKIIRKKVKSVLDPEPKAEKGAGLSVHRDEHWLVIRGAHLPGGEIRINYIEAYCRPGSTDADWVKHTVIKHESRLLSSSTHSDTTKVKIADWLEDGVIVEHLITASGDEVTFEVTAKNPTATASKVHWAQPCVRLGEFTGHSTDLTLGDIDDYLPKCFIFAEGKLEYLPTQPWAKEARYTPGQVWCPAHVPRTDVNPRPLSQIVPSNGLIGCVSGDGKLVFATAWEPYQELFQGVARCLHSDFRIGGLAAGATKTVRGKIYVVENDIPALLERYGRDFPEHQSK